jgi:hypothetical protein
VRGCLLGQKNSFIAFIRSNVFFCFKNTQLNGYIPYFNFLLMAIRKHNIAEMNVSGVKKYSANLDLAKRFPMVFKLKRISKNQIIPLSILVGILFWT